MITADDHVTTSSRSVVVRGHVVSCLDDPFVTDGASVLLDLPDGVVVVEGGIITGVGPFSQFASALPAGVPVHHYPHRIISPGFVDAHVHYVQTPIIGSYGQHLLDWLNTYTFPGEERFRDRDYAQGVAKVFIDQLLRNGTTSALVFCAVYPQSADAFFEEATRRNLRVAAGKALMDRNAPAAVLDTAQSGYDDSRALLEKWHRKGRTHYAISPRFAPTSTEAQLEMAGALRREFPSALVHSHVSENVAEVAWVRSLFPDRSGYLDVYDHAGLLGPGSVLAHGVHLSGSELERCYETGTALAHCPTSNLFLGSGLFPMNDVKNERHPVNVGLGTDVGAGTSFSLLTTMGEAYKVAELASHPLNAIKLFYLATLGGARALGFDSYVGSIAVGKEADLVVLDTEATPLLAYRHQSATSTEDELFMFTVLGDDRAIAATYVAGALAHQRDNQES